MLNKVLLLKGIVIEEIWKIIKIHGLPYLLIMAFVAYLYIEVIEMKQNYNTCNETLIQNLIEEKRRQEQEHREQRQAQMEATCQIGLWMEKINDQLKDRK